MARLTCFEVFAQSTRAMEQNVECFGVLVKCAVERCDIVTA